MKALKISLVVIILAAIGAGIFSWTQEIEDPPIIIASENEFISIIEQEINELKAKPDSIFCLGSYKKIISDINDFYEGNDFSKNQSENDQLNELLKTNLYSTYTKKFIKQAFHVFGKSEWKMSDLRLIEAEKNTLKESKFLASGSPVDEDFTKIQTILNKYYEIDSFIRFCNNFSYSGNNSGDRFPVTDVKSKIKRSRRILPEKTDSLYVHNCTRLSDGLKGIPQSLFKKHVLYLDDKIEYRSNMFCHYVSHKEYSQYQNTPLKNEIKDLGNSTFYTSVNVANEYKRLLKLWSNDNIKAYNATYPCD